MNNNYYTFDSGQIYQHHSNNSTNYFYGTNYDSDVTVVFNDNPGSVKSFGTINYEGTQARVPNFDTESSSQWLTGNYSSNDGLTTNNSITDGQYHNLGGAGADGLETAGWYVDNIMTNMQSSENIYFIEKEGKWFGQISGETTNLANLDENEFSVQGLGTATLTHSDTSTGDTTEETLTFTVQNSSTSSGGDSWD